MKKVFHFESAPDPYSADAVVLCDHQRADSAAGCQQSDGESRGRLQYQAFLDR